MVDFNTMPRDPAVAKLIAEGHAMIDAHVGERLPPLRPAIDHAERALRVQAMQFAVMALPELHQDSELIPVAGQILTFLKGGDAPVDATETEA